MASSQSKQHKFVMPGEKIATKANEESVSKTSSICGITKQDGNTSHWRRDPLIPKIGDTVICKVVKITMHLAQCEILCVGNDTVSMSYIGVIRSQNVRQTEIDSVEIWKCFRPSDIVKCKIISLGNQRDYYLSSADPDLGVIVANSTFGYPMKPISWNKMQCPVTKIVEMRKVAKIS